MSAESCAAPFKDVASFEEGTVAFQTICAYKNMNRLVLTILRLIFADTVVMAGQNGLRLRYVLRGLFNSPGEVLGWILSLGPALLCSTQFETRSEVGQQWPDLSTRFTLHIKSPKIGR